jgi:hypothetical protein
MSTACPDHYREKKGFMERANLKNRFAIFEICSLLFSFWRRSRRITPRIHVILQFAPQKNKNRIGLYFFAQNNSITL